MVAEDDVVRFRRGRRGGILVPGSATAPAMGAAAWLVGGIRLRRRDIGGLGLPRFSLVRARRVRESGARDAARGSAAPSCGGSPAGTFHGVAEAGVGISGFRRRLGHCVPRFYAQAAMPPSTCSTQPLT